LGEKIKTPKPSQPEGCGYISSSKSLNLGVGKFGNCIFLLYIPRNEQITFKAKRRAKHLGVQPFGLC
jgi:hypothetical protein